MSTAIFIDRPIKLTRDEEAPKRTRTACVNCGTDSGKFTFIGNGKYKCEKCAKPVEQRDSAKSTFPFTADHIVPGQKIEVRNISHLRTLERDYNVSSVAYNSDERNWER